MPFANLLPNLLYTHANALAGGSEEGCVKAVLRTRERRALLKVKLARNLPRRCVCVCVCVCM